MPAFGPQSRPNTGTYQGIRTPGRLVPAIATGVGVAI